MPEEQQSALELMESGPSVIVITVGEPWRGRALRKTCSEDFVLSLSIALLIALSVTMSLITRTCILISIMASPVDILASDERRRRGKKRTRRRRRKNRRRKRRGRGGREQEGEEEKEEEEEEVEDEDEEEDEEHEEIQGKWGKKWNTHELKAHGKGSIQRNWGTRRAV
ncbi:hypothetical protein STEG23_020829 [Scotinomys teguina]